MNKSGIFGKLLVKLFENIIISHYDMSFYQVINMSTNVGT